MVLASLSIAEELFEIRRKLNQSQEDEERLMHSVNFSLEKLLEEIQ